MTQEQSPPVLVIGAGLAGLAASLSLARAGRPVLLLEAGEAAGGCCSTARVDGFTFNNGAIYVAVPSLLRRAFDSLGLDFDADVPLVRIAQPHETHLEDGTVVRLSAIDESSVAGPRASARTAMLREGLASLEQSWGPVYRTLVRDVLPFEPSLVRTLSRLWRYLPRMGGTVDRLIAGCFPDPGLQAAVASTLLYTGTAPDRLPATQVIGLLALLEEGFHLPRAGMGAITAALHRALERQGVPVRFGARVETIEVRRGEVCAVALQGGERIEAEQVIATCAGFEVVERLLPAAAVPRGLARRADKAPLSHRAIAIQLGCSGAALPPAFVVNHVPAMAEQGRMHVSRPGVPRWLAWTCPTAVLPEMAPEGRAVIELYAPVSGIERSAEWTHEMTQRAVADHVASLETKLPGLSIDTVRVMDPQDFARRRHLYEGALYGIAPGASPNAFFPHRSRVGGLYLAGQTTFPGYGVPSAMWSGIQVAEAVEKGGA